MGDLANSAPEGLETVRAFVNSYDVEPGLESLDSPTALSDWLAEHGLAEGALNARPADLRRAREMREALRGLILANNGESLDPGALETLNRAAARAKVTPAFDGHASWRIEPAAGGVDRALGRLLAIVLQAMSEGTWERLKACSEHTCQWAFYDASKNRSGRWCTMAVCGNRAKARGYRERAKTASRRPK